MAHTLTMLSAIMVILLLCCWGLMGQARKRSTASAPQAVSPRRLHDRLYHWALRSPWQGMGRLPHLGRTPLLVRRLALCRDDLPALEMLRRDCRSLLTQLLPLQAALRRAPRLPCTPAGEVRMLLLSRQLARHSPALDGPSLLQALEAWHKGGALTYPEREILPLCIRLALVQQLGELLHDLREDIRAHRLGRRLARRAAHARRPMALLSRYQLPETAAHALLTALREEEAHSLLAALEDMTEQAGHSAEELARRHTQRQSMLAGEISRILCALQSVDHLDWPRLLEASDSLHRMLLEDPAGVYPRMDFDTRRLYRSRVAALSRLFACEEIRILRTILALCADNEPDGLHDHAGWYLLEPDGMTALRHALMTRKGALRLWLQPRRLLIFRMLLGVCALGCAYGFLRFGFTLWMLPFFLGVTGCTARALLTPLARKAWPVPSLPRMHIPAITEDLRTLVVIPAVIRDHTQAVALVRRLLVARKAFPEGAVDCLLLADYDDCMTQTSHSDRLITQAVAEAIGCVDGDGGQYMYLQRRRVWSQDMRAFIGRERRHGALESLNRLIVQGECEDLFDYASVPPAHFHRRYAYVLALEEEAVPAPDMLLPLLGALTHPLNERRHTPDGLRGVSILQPRKVPDPERAHTRIAQAQEHASSNRLPLRPGWYTGCGLYRPDAMLEDTDGWIRPGAMLHPEPLEGALCGCTMDDAAVLYHPQAGSLMGWMRQAHRRTRSNWQLLPWLFPYVKTGEGVMRNPLGGTSRYRLSEELRSSIVPACQLALLVYAALMRSGGLLAAALFLPEVSSLLSFSAEALLASLVRTVLLPLRAILRLDAAGRTLWRMLITNQRRLEHLAPTHADGSELSALENWSQWGFALALAAASVYGEGICWAGIAAALCMGGFPPLHTWLDSPIRSALHLKDSMEATLLDAAESTWRYFEETVAEADHHLPPARLQVKPARTPERRTSPGDIGLYLLACLAAREAGLIPAHAMAQRIAGVMDALEALPLWHGLPYESYASGSLQPLPPRRIESAACGLLCACLMAAAQGLRCCLAELEEEHHMLSARLDAFAAAMELHRLYDPQAHLFYLALEEDGAIPSAAHHELLTGGAQLLSYVALLRREVPLRHFARLSRAAVRAGCGMSALSPNGSAQEYMEAHLLLPLFQGTALARTASGALQVQKQHAVEGMFGFAHSSFWGFDAQMHYRSSPFGTPETSVGPGRFQPVIAPYAAALFLPVDPQAACESLTRLRSRGMLGRLGYFESIDFSPAHLPEGQSEAVVQCYVTRHQGILLCAVCNALTGGALVRLFAGIPQAAAFLPLLKERSLPGPALPPRALHPEARIPREEPFRRLGQGLVTPVDAHIIGTEDASLLLSAQGMGVLHSHGISLTRFTGDPTLVEGPQFYLADGQRVYRMGDPTLPGDNLFTEGSIRMTRAMGRFHCTLSCLVDPLQGAFIHMLEVENLSTREKAVDVASFLQPTLTPPASPGTEQDELLIESAHPEERVLTLTRLPCREGDVPLTLCHALSTHESLMALSVQTDRTAFQGRNGSLHAPSSLAEPAVQGLVGMPVTPCASLRARLSIPGRGRATLLFVTRLMRQGEEFSLETLSPRLTDVAQLITLAQLQSRTVTEALPITQAEARSLSRLFGMLLWRCQPHQGAVSPLQLPASALKDAGLTTDLPVLTLALSNPQGSSLLHEAISLACWMRMLGQPITLCCLCEGDHAKAVHEHTVEALQASVLGRHAAEHAHVLVAPDMTEGLRETIEAYSRAILYEGAGTLTAQVEAMEIRHNAPQIPQAEAHAPALAPEALRFDNGLGGFQPQTDDYVIHLAPGESTPAPWRSLLHSSYLATLCTDGGLGTTFAGEAPLTALCADSVAPAPAECVYLRDEATGALFSPTPLPMGQSLTCRIQFGPGCSQYRALGHGLDITLTASIAPGAAFSARTLRMKNTTDKPRRLALAVAARFTMGQDESLCCLTPVAGGIIAHSPDMAHYGCISMVEGPCHARRMSATSFHGLHGGAPSALFAPTMDESGSMAVLSMAVELAPHAAADATWIIGTCRQVDDMERTLARLRKQGASAWHRNARQKWGQRLSQLTVSTPEDSLNILMNRILLWQAHAAPPQGASAGSWPLQGTAALILTEPQRVRSQLLHMAGQQYIEGDLFHRSHRTRRQADRLFLPLMTSWYVQRTGDRDILHQQVPWLVGGTIPPDEQTIHDTPYQTQETDPLHVHCLRALTSIKTGPHGLPIMDDESVWLGMLYARALKDYAECCDEAARDELLAHRQKMLTAIERDGWAGRWYSRACTRDGASTQDARTLDSLCQGWAVLALGVTERSAQGMEAAWQALYDPRYGLLKQLDRSAGSQNTLAAVWMLRALCALGWRDRAWELLQALNPIHHGAQWEHIARYRLEPYALAEEISAHPQQMGRGLGWGDHAAAAWLYAAVLEKLLGFEKQGHCIRMRPMVPPAWEDFTITLTLGASTWRITCAKDVAAPILDGAPLQGEWLHLTDDGKIHQARLPLG